MPELPEVEVTCQGLRPHLLGRTVLAVRSSG
ncbi:MAG: formamidopyrimidine-DNA glycosylase, partial [Candidatus Electrothrix sp. ATG2]|nr:formamidopyrimidine-DNA glycosylase [Candidatus Electrothrix sp. ATG2]